MNKIIDKNKASLRGLKMELTRQTGRPEDVSGRLEKETRVYDMLDLLGIEYERIDHEPAFSDNREVCEAIEASLGARICKNLLLCNRQKTKFFLLMLPGEKPFKSSVISKQAGSSRLSFAEPEYMEKYLDTTPGSASLMGLMNDKENKVQLLVDEDVLDAEYLGCHPCINTSSLRLKTEDAFGTFLEAVHHDLIKVSVP